MPCGFETETVPETEITSEMIEAGSAECARLDWRFDELSEVVQRNYLAMASVKSGSKLLE